MGLQLKNEKGNNSEVVPGKFVPPVQTVDATPSNGPIVTAPTSIWTQLSSRNCVSPGYTAYAQNILRVASPRFPAGTVDG